jgi:PQQ-like domain
VIRRRLWLAAVPLLLVGCSSAGGHSSASPGAATAHKKPPTGWARTDLVPLSMPQLAGGRLVLYAEGGDGIQLIGLDPETGKTVWRDNASPGATTAGVNPVLGVVGSTVAIFSPVDNTTRTSQLVGIDAANGRPLWHTPTGSFEDWPAPCPDAPSDICTSGSLGDATQTLALRYRASDGTAVGAVLISQSTGGRMIGPDLYDPAVRDPEAMVAVNGSSVTWTEPLSTVFSLQGDSTNWGWDIDRVPAAGLYVGSVGGAPVKFTATTGVTSPARSMTAGFRISDGSVAWQDPGTSYACGLLPCPGRGLTASGALTQGLRFRVTGSITSNLSTGTATLSPGGNVTIEAFDLATGKTLWSYDAGSNVNLLSNAPTILGSEVVAMPTSNGGMAALNLVTGKHVPVSGTAVGWCTSGVTYTTKVPYPNTQGGTTYQRPAFSGYYPCTVDGDNQSLPATVPSYVGVTVDGLTVTSDSSEVAATPASS